MTTLAEKYQHKLYWEILRKQGVLKEILLEWLQVLELRIRVYRERQQLKLMSDLMLQDIGLTREAADAEARSAKLPQARRDALRKLV